MNRRDLLILMALIPSCSFISLSKDQMMNKQYDVLIVGGGPAGLTAALALARGGRSVLIFDDQKPRNALAKHMQNFPSHDGLPPTEFKKLVLTDLKEYPKVHFESHRVDEITKTENGFRAISNGKEYQGRKIMLAHGMRDEMLPLPGFKEVWGRSIFQCPYCHGHEIRNSPMGIIGAGMMAKHMVPLIKGLTDDVVLFTNGEEIENRELIEKNGVKIFDEKILRFIHEGETLKAVQLENDLTIERSYLFIKVPQKLTTDLGLKLGCTTNEMGFYAVDETNKTTAPGIYAAGDIVSMRQSVLGACASGQFAGAAINYELLSEDFKEALPTP